MIVKALNGLAAGALPATPQPEDGATYAAKLDKAEGRLDFGKPAAELERTVRAFDPWPGTWFEMGKDRIKVLAAEAVDGGGDAAPGTVLDDRATIKCGDGALRLTRLQRPGKGPMEADAFLRGFDLPKGAVL